MDGPKWTAEDVRNGPDADHDISGIPAVAVPVPGMSVPSLQQGMCSVDGLQRTLTSSNGALPTHTTAPLAPPASRLVMATSLAVS